MKSFKSYIFIASLMLLAGCSIKTPGVIMVSDSQQKSLNQLNLLRDKSIEDSLTWNVTHAGVEDRPWLGVNPEIRLRLTQLENSDLNDDLTFAKDSNHLLDLMLARGLSDFEVTESGLSEPDEFMAEFRQAVWLEQDQLQSCSTAKERAAWISDLKSGLPVYDKQPGKTMRMVKTFPAIPFVKLWINNHSKNEWRGPNWREFESSVIYAPETFRDEELAHSLSDAADQDLLAFYSPKIIQEEGVTPDFRDNMIGKASLIPDREGNPVAEIDPSEPVVYGHVTHAWLNDKWVNQVNYSFWYPDHPEQKKNDPEAGRTEGLMIRITLDAQNRPVVSEATYACGCYHRMYPVENSEYFSQDEYYDITKATKTVSGKIDPIIPESGGRFDPSNPHPLVYVRSGFHLVAAVIFEEASDSVPGPEISYRLHRSVELETLPWGDQSASLFDRDGLVRGADRPEAKLLAPSGIYHAGTPRIRGMQLIHFDQYDYNSPGLLNSLLNFQTQKENHVTYNIP